VDLGAGDGAFVVATAAREPHTLAIAVDANASAMHDGSRRARRRHLLNALFVVASAEALPRELDAAADALHVHFPWGSLLRGLVRGDDAVLAGIARLTKPGAAITLLVSVTARDHLPGVENLDAAAYAKHGLELETKRLATADDLVAARSTWAKRLRAGSERDAWLVQFARVCN
jgi:16S rRNA (adenine(1408)-N(1))-methyltransferase